MTNRTLTMPLADWDDLVGRVALFAHRNPRDPLPILSSVHLYEAGGRLYAEATDRYRLGSTVAPDTVVAPEGFTALISVESINDLARITKAPARHRGSLRITLTSESENRLGVSIEALPGLGDIVMSLQLVDGKYPDLRSILHKALTEPPADAPAAFNPVFLADYRKVAGSNEAVVITPHGNQPALIRVGYDFIGALVPVRFTGDPAPDLDAPWGHLAPAPTA